MHSECNSTWRRALSVALLLGLAAPAYAVDGVIEINQARVKAAGGFPFYISKSGSYRLTSNLDVTDVTARPPGTLAENTTAIYVTGNYDVTVDLNGFAIQGPTSCSGSPLSCSPTGSGIGILAQAGGSIAVMNGTVRGMGAYGILVTNMSYAEKVRALYNGGVGILAITATGCTAEYNGGTGIAGLTTINSTAMYNGGFGIEGKTVTNSTAMSNGGTGIGNHLAWSGGEGADTVTNSTADNNGGAGIYGATVTSSTAFNNGGKGIVGNTGNAVANSTASANGDVGIQASTATGCTASQNTGSQLVALGITNQNICEFPVSTCP